MDSRKEFYIFILALLPLILCQNINHDQEYKCPQYWLKFQESCYRFIKSPQKAYTDARRNCQVMFFFNLFLWDKICTFTSRNSSVTQYEFRVDPTTVTTDTPRRLCLLTVTYQPQINIPTRTDVLHDYASFWSHINPKTTVQYITFREVHWCHWDSHNKFS